MLTVVHFTLIALLWCGQQIDPILVESHDGYYRMLFSQGIPRDMERLKYFMEQEGTEIIFYENDEGCNGPEIST